MSRGINKVILVGHTGGDPEMKYTQSGTAIATVSLATTNVRKDKDGQQVEKTEWHRIKFFGKVAEIVGEYVKKGAQLYVEGRIEYGSYEKDGVKHYTTDIIGEDMQMLGARSEGGQGGRSIGRHSSVPNGRPTQSRPQPAPPAPVPLDDFEDSDIPF